MFEEDMGVPVYLITGFLEAGKTSFLKFTLEQDYFQIDGTTLLILTEEGEEEYDEEKLKKKYNTVIEVVEEASDFTPEYLKTLNRRYKPERVIIEFNPLWSVSRFEQMELPPFWDPAQHIVIVDASCFQVYMQNLKSLFMEMCRNADMVIFNRSKREYPLATFRRSIKVANQRCEVLFEDEEGELDDIFEDDMPFDISGDFIDVPYEDFGLWYIDMMDHPEKYDGKTVRYTGLVVKSRKKDAGYFMPGRKAMTCCADDMTFIGFICYSDQAQSLKTGQWVTVTAKVKHEFNKIYREEGPVLYAENVEPAETPEDPLVYFN